MQHKFKLFSTRPWSFKSAVFLSARPVQTRSDTVRVDASACVRTHVHAFAKLLPFSSVCHPLPVHWNLKGVLDDIVWGKKKGCRKKSLKMWTSNQTRRARPRARGRLIATAVSVCSHRVRSPQVNFGAKRQVSGKRRTALRKPTIRSIYTWARRRAALSRRSRVPIFFPISRDSGVLLRSTSTENLSPDKVWPGFAHYF